MNRRWRIYFILALAFLLRIYRLDASSLWYDEGYSAYLGAHLPLDQALDLTTRDVVPPLYYLLLRLWLPLVGTSEFALRYLSVLFGVVAVALLVQIGRRLGGKQVGVVGAALGAVAPVLIWVSQDARMYGPLITWSLLATWGLLRATASEARQESRRRGWAVFAIGGLAALYTHTVTAFWLLGQVAFAMWVVAQRRERKLATEALVTLSLMGAAFLPWVIIALFSFQTNTGYWSGYLPPAYLWRVAWETFVGGQHLSPAQTELAAIWFGVAALLSWIGLLFRRPRVAGYLVSYLVLPLLAMGLAFRHTPKLAARYPTAMAPALLLALACGVRVKRNVFAVFLLGVLLFSSLGAVNLYTAPEYAKDDWRAVAAHVQSHRQPDEAVILVSGHAFPVFAYYFGWDEWHALPDDVQLDVTHVLNYPTIAPQLNQILEGVGGAWLILWQDEVVDPTGLVPALLRDVGRLSSDLTLRGATVGDTISLQHVRFERPAQFPDHLPVQRRLDRRVAPGLALLGYSLPTAPHPADVVVPMRAFWQADEPLEGVHAVSLRLFDSLEQEWARADSFLAGDYFSERWPVAVPVMGQYTITLPLGAPPGGYTPVWRIYRGDEVFDELTLPSLAITRPLTTAAASEMGLVLSSSGPAAEISLAGVGFDQQTVTPCRDWSLSLAWQVKATPAQDYRLRLTLGQAQVETPLAPDFSTTRWRPGDVWRTRHRLFVDCRALDGTVPVVGQLLGTDGRPVGAPFDLGRVTVVAGRQFAAPDDLTASTDVALPGVGDLVGYRLEKTEFHPGENLEITLYWRAGWRIDRNYSVFVHVASDRVYAQHDGWPGEGQKPTSAWALQEVITDRHIVPIQPDVPPGAYQVVVGMYDAETLQPLEAIDSLGHSIAGGRIVLQSIKISSP